MYLVERNGRHDWTRTSDLYRVNFEVQHLKPFACLAFPFFANPGNHRKQPSFGDELVTSFFCRVERLQRTIFQDYLCKGDFATTNRLHMPKQAPQIDATGRLGSLA